MPSLRAKLLAISAVFSGTVSIALAAPGEGRLLPLMPVRDSARIAERAERPHFHPAEETARGLLKKLDRKNPWSLPNRTLAAGGGETIRVLVLRFNFQLETTDNPLTTGRGRMNLERPFASPADSARYYDSVGHFVDPPPHNAAYFDAHMRALDQFYEYSSNGGLNLTWDIFPPNADSAYTLADPMSRYGACSFDSVVSGLEALFVDCISTADSVSPEIDFSDYGSIIIFHAGSDRQNDIGFPPTCEDLFTGFIRFGDSVLVDNDSVAVREALLMPETASQDNRGTALNAVIAHEFGHQLGLVDLYDTRTFATTIGDFATMDHNGFKTGLDFGWTVGSIFGTIPVYHDAWSRAFLGFDSVVDIRSGQDIHVIAANVVAQGIKIARVPISETEYYLIENRIEDNDGKETAILADSATSVILGPVNRATREFTGEYDALLPGSGVVIYRIDERVAGLDYDADDLNNFFDNDLQWDWQRKFMTLIEGDGFENLTGRCVSGCGFISQAYGWEGDMYRDDRNTALTPSTNPPSRTAAGGNSRVRVTNISRDSLAFPGVPFGAVVSFDIETDGLVPSFPVRVGTPTSAIGPLSPISSDLDGNGSPELLVASGRYLTAFTSIGQGFLDATDPCVSCPQTFDTIVNSFSTSIIPLPILSRSPGDITAGPVVGDFGGQSADPFVAVGYFNAGRGFVTTISPRDADDDGFGDIDISPIFTDGTPIGLFFGRSLWVVTDSGEVWRLASQLGTPAQIGSIAPGSYRGGALVNDFLLLVTRDGTETELILVTPVGARDTLTIPGSYNFGPVAFSRGSGTSPEAVIASADGEVMILTVDTTLLLISTTTQEQVADSVTAAPIFADVDGDNVADLVVSGVNRIYALNLNLVAKTDFPIEIDDRFPAVPLIGPPVSADLFDADNGELFFGTSAGNCYAFGPAPSFGFPLPAGDGIVGSPLLVNDSAGTKLGVHGQDGWFYLWEMPQRADSLVWPMGGYEPGGSHFFAGNVAGSAGVASEPFPKDQFFNYPNPVTDGISRIRYMLGTSATSVRLKLFDLSGEEVASLDGSGEPGENEVLWNCSKVTPGIYRCVIEVTFGGSTENAFTDIAVIR